jgi:hypothetical protein
MAVAVLGAVRVVVALGVGVPVVVGDGLGAKVGVVVWL